MQEIAESYPKRAKGFLSRDTVITISLRGKEIMVLNLRAPPTLAFYESKGDFESLTWFIGELKKDIVGPDPVPRPRRSSTLDVGEHGDIEQVLEDLKSHPNCRKAWYLGSVKAVEVHSKSKLSKNFRLKALKKRGGVTLEEAAAKGLAFFFCRESNRMQQAVHVPWSLVTCLSMGLSRSGRTSSPRTRRRKAERELGVPAGPSTCLDAKMATAATDAPATDSTRSCVGSQVLEVSLACLSRQNFGAISMLKRSISRNESRGSS